MLLMPRFSSPALSVRVCRYDSVANREVAIKVIDLEDM